ncbi:MFS transporter [Thermoflexus sp.]|uniref:MFS transporter n=1 Tax=Thermoflexus sp. TaxID=1969742 RepID=UPI0025DA3A62|nr:MFS transporter [Thermoflexus sp.]MDW8180804.1 MFS transporter [Anaerolineae bacterium]MCS6965068.1 MFS transporter [Thermoflexus sp.]MCS7351349.1 MFS transporter [Thermoflexus sp.]MCX7689207.1 MFS transporter [Thermoflexus sp.]MDW8185502.1 MFS transporter [Anaerolineae bacterium]
MRLPFSSPWRIIQLLMVSEILWALGEGLFFYLVPVYVQELGATPSQVGIAIGIGELILTVVYLPAGWVADRLPHKPLMLGGWIAGLVGVLAMAGANSWQTFIPGLTLYLVSGYCLPIINAYVARMAGPIPLERAFPLLSASYALGGVLTPALGGWLAHHWGLRRVLLISAGLFALSTLAALFLPMDPPPERSGHRSVRELWQGIPWRFGLALLGLFAIGQVGLVLLPNFLQQAGGWTKAHLGLFASLQALGIVLLGPVLGRWDQGRTRPLGLLSAWGLGWIAFLLLLVGFRYLPVVIGAMMLLGGVYAGYSLAAARILRLASQETRATSSALVHTARSLALTLAAPAAGFLFALQPAYPLQVAWLLLPLAIGWTFWAGALDRKAEAVSSGRGLGKNGRDL